MFRVSTTPIIRITQNCNHSLRYCAATSLQLGQVGGRQLHKTWPVPEAVIAVLSTHDDGCGWHQKRVEWNCRIINRQLCVASRWTVINCLTPSDLYTNRTAPLTSKRCILYIYSTNVGTEYFKHSLNSPLFSSSKCSLFHNANFFGSCIIHILYTECAEIKIIIPAPKG